ncbi:MAG: adenylosuccinate lyase [Defluviitaleaceae bacterium]|nr:adenylosuccinate lyase [Defluviitaleaceae bacterium]
MLENIDKSKYISPFSSRYAGGQMQWLFSEQKRVETWRRLWVALAKGQRQLGLDISDGQIAQMEAFASDINFERVAEVEARVRHDVMANVHAFGEQCPGAAAIIHLGATSAYVVDNGDLIIQREALELVKAKTLKVLSVLADFAEKYKDMPTLGFTHFQPAQLTTVGKRATLWMHDLLMDLEEIDFVLDSLKFLGSKGTTGTHASFLELFDGDGGKVKQLESIIAAEFDFDAVYPVSGQTYSRKIDSRFVNALGQLAQSASKFANDMRLLAHLKEMEEPFESEQIGSSAMAYKRNPMRCERVNALSRHVITQAQNTAATAAAQWLERTLDDSANKRVAVPEAFLAMDGILNLYINIAGGLVVYPKMIHSRIMAELPFMATENIMMDGVKRGGNRQDLHEAIRVHSMAASARVKQEGLQNDLLERIAADPTFNTTLEELTALLNPAAYTGRASEQTQEFLQGHVRPVLERNALKNNDEIGDTLHV